MENQWARIFPWSRETPEEEAEPRRILRSADSKQLVKPAHNLRGYGYRAFSCAAPSLWNSLPQEVSFKTKLKTHLFKRAYTNVE